MRLLLAFACAALCLETLSGPHSQAAEMKIKRDVPYAEPANARRTLDVYAPVAGEDHPILIWIHGGGWRAGDKAGVQAKPQAFVDRGFIFVSINYRFFPNVTLQQQAGDVAQAIRWIHQRAAAHGGATENLFVAGHSAGAHLAALVCTDGSYLEAHGLSLKDIRGCIPVDTAVYDAQKQISQRSAARAKIYTGPFTAKAETQRQLSPLMHVAKNKQIPPFLILHVASRPDSTAQSQAFANTLREAGVDANTVAGEGKTHGTINRDLGMRDDPPTKAVFDFLQREIKKEK